MQQVKLGVAIRRQQNSVEFLPHNWRWQSRTENTCTIKIQRIESKTFLAFSSFSAASSFRSLSEPQKEEEFTVTKSKIRNHKIQSLILLKQAEDFTNLKKTSSLSFLLESGCMDAKALASTFLSSVLSACSAFLFSSRTFSYSSSVISY